MGEPRQSIFYGQQVEEHDDATQAKRVIGTGGALATEEKQDAIIAAQVAAIAAQNLGELAPILRSMLLFLTSPGNLDKPNNATRIIPVGGTVTTVTGLTNIDGYQGKLLVINQNNAAWASVVRSRIS